MKDHHSTTRRKFIAGASAALAGAACTAAAGWGFTKLPRFGSLPKGGRLERIAASPNYRNGAFRNEEPEPVMKRAAKDDGRGGLFNMMFKKRELRLLPPKGAIKTVKTDLHSLARAVDAFVWFGHSSCLLQTDGMRILVDPVFYRASPLPGLFGEPFDGTDIYKPADIPDIDTLLITHDHWDHLDCRTAMALRERTGKVVCPLGVGAHLERWGFDPEKIVELDWGESSSIFHCLPSRHFSGRGLVRNQTLWASFMVCAPSRTVYFAGDGGYDGRFKRIAAKFPEIDLAVIENGQYNERWAQNHTLPRQLASVMRDLAAKRYITVHHGKFSISTHPWDEPYRNEAAAAEETGSLLTVPAIGEVVRLCRLPVLDQP